MSPNASNCDLKKVDFTGDPRWSDDLGVMSPALFLLSYTGIDMLIFKRELWQTASAKQPNWNRYRQQVSILCPRGYEPRALPLRHAGYVLLMFSVACAMTTSFCKAGEL